jgi:hypothetical protein
MEAKTKTFEKTKLVSIGKSDVAWTIGLTLIAIISPALLAHTPNNQWITGTIVNTTLFLASWRLGVANAIFVGSIPSTIALLRGLLAAPMAPLIPYIIISNAILAIVFSLAKKKPFVGVILASIAKSAFLFSIIMLVAPKVPAQLAHMLQLPQLITAMAGGLIAISIISATKKVSKAN